MISDIKALQIAKQVDYILHVPGNYRGGNLEMTIVMDSRLEPPEMKENVKKVAAALKRSNEIFRNVRLNLVRWDNTQKFNNEVVPMIFLQTGACFSSEEKQSDAEIERTEQMTLDYLLTYLKTFHARSKVVLVFAGEGVVIGDKERAKVALSPFLKQKLLLLKGEEVLPGMKLFMECI